MRLGRTGFRTTSWILENGFIGPAQGSRALGLKDRAHERLWKPDLEAVFSLVPEPSGRRDVDIGKLLPRMLTLDKESLDILIAELNQLVSYSVLQWCCAR